MMDRFEVLTLRWELGEWDNGAMRVLLRRESLPRDLRWFKGLYR